MKFLYIVIGVFLLLCLVGILFGRYRTKRAIRKVKERPDEIKLLELNQSILPFGYSFDYEQGIFTTTMHPWQREMGYCRLYDDSAFSMSMVIDCEPVEFEYAGMLYMIEFWKGQYGMTSGGEVGLYKAEKPEHYRKGDFVFYQSVPDAELLVMSMTLYKNGKRLMHKKAKHWWLTAFELGEFSSPRELTAEVGIEFTGYGMRNAFLDELCRMGYHKHEVWVSGLLVVVLFKVPKSRQPERRWRLLRRMTMKKNRYFCKKYRKLTSCFETTLDRIDFLRVRHKILAGFALRFGKITERSRRRISRRIKGRQRAA